MTNQEVTLEKLEQLATEVEILLIDRENIDLYALAAAKRAEVECRVAVERRLHAPVARRLAKASGALRVDRNAGKNLRRGQAGYTVQQRAYKKAWNRRRGGGGPSAKGYETKTRLR